MAITRQFLVVLAATLLLLACSLLVQGDPVLHNLKEGDSLPLLTRPLATNTKVGFSIYLLFGQLQKSI